MSAWAPFAAERFCYVTTTERVTVVPRRIEIWFAIDEAILYMLSNGRDQSVWL